MCVRLGFIKPGYAEVYCAHCGYCIGYVHREEVIVSTNLDTGRQTTVNRWFPETNRLFTSGWATRGEAVRMLKCLDCKEKTT